MAPHILPKKRDVESRVPVCARVIVVTELEKVVGDARAEEIEEAAFRATLRRSRQLGRPTRVVYSDIAVDVLAKARQDPESVDSLVAFWDEDKLMEGLPVAEEFVERQRRQLQNRKEVSALVEGYKSREPEDSRFLVRCRRCGASGDDVQEIDAQTRSADEGASVLGLCSKCGFRWKA